MQQNLLMVVGGASLDWRWIPVSEMELRRGEKCGDVRKNASASIHLPRARFPQIKAVPVQLTTNLRPVTSRKTSIVCLVSFWQTCS
ncbi:hypothetical protein NDU88_005325 [Pleurodeles waltl]|uniref:Uncharacterized protein n=1 Tax=Pleurodeles waltl TaxID=8319 RepID=A0AAV7L2F1_PLEWA|nr:hypothetical protein NDU88_005325 [Pleurodeles waltl]